MRKTILKMNSIVLSLAFSLTLLWGCGLAQEPALGNYLLNGSDESSYIQVENDNIEFVNVDMNKLADSLINGTNSIFYTDTTTGEDHEIVVAEATEEELSEVRNDLLHSLDGKQPYLYEKDGNVAIIYLTERAGLMLDYNPKTKTITFLEMDFTLASK
ncbi:MAG: hypothetical protein LBB42_05495 [Coriobacteriales bacterium]|jgi:hypothetical protein|nr:hypothetical protein [Coriobacteriales bacterium]